MYNAKYLGEKILGMKTHQYYILKISNCCKILSKCNFLKQKWQILISRFLKIGRVLLFTSIHTLLFVLLFIQTSLFKKANK